MKLTVSEFLNKTQKAHWSVPQETSEYYVFSFCYKDYWFDGKPQYYSFEEVQKFLLTKYKHVRQIYCCGGTEYIYMFCVFSPINNTNG